MLKRNLIANYLGQGWTALMSLAFVPLYIRYLGMEAYGLIGLFAVLQGWLILLDAGLTPTLGREMARFKGNSHSPESIRDLLRTVEVLALGMALFTALGIWLASDWLATHWLRANKLPTEVVSQAFAIMGGVTALRIVEGIYRSSIVGLQQQVFLNALGAGFATLRGLGAVVILAWYAPTIQAFFIWQGLISLVATGALAWATYASLSPPARASRFSLTALLRVWRFAGGVFATTCLTLLLTQIDKVLLSKFLSLHDFGVYSLAVAVSAALYMLITPVTNAWYPKLCELHSLADYTGLAKVYHHGAQLVTVVAGSAAIVLVLFSETFLHLWTQDGVLARQAAPILSLLLVGNLLNGLMWIPHQTQLAQGWTSLSVWTNVVAVLFIVPAILWAAPRYGAEGAAWVWVALNAAYLVFGAQFMYRRILREEGWRWFWNDLALPLGLAAAASGVVRLSAPAASTVVMQLAILATASVATFGAALLGAGHTRKAILNLLGPRFSRVRTST